jgi:hypothetical protein
MLRTVPGAGYISFAAWSWWNIKYKGATGLCLGQNAGVATGPAGVFGPKAQPISQARATPWFTLFPGRS